MNARFKVSAASVCNLSDTTMTIFKIKKSKGQEAAQIPSEPVAPPARRGSGEERKMARFTRIARNGAESLIEASEGLADLGVKTAQCAKETVTTVARNPRIALEYGHEKVILAKDTAAAVVKDRDQYAARVLHTAIAGKDAVIDAAKNPKEALREARQLAEGFSRGVMDSAKGAAGHLLVGNADFRELNAQIFFQCEEFRALGKRPPALDRITDRSGFLDAILAGGDARRVALESAVPEDVLQAYAAQYPNLTESFRDKIRGLSEEQIRGLIGGVKGKLFEFQYTDHLNGGILPEGYQAVMAESATQRGWDIVVNGPDGEIAQLLQLKATDSVERVRLALQVHPDIDVVVPSELHAELVMRGYSEHIVDSGISHVDLLDQMDDATDIARDGFGNPSPIVLALLAFSSYSDETLSAFERSRLCGSRSGSYMLTYLAGLAADAATGGLPLVSVVASVTTRAVIGKGNQKLHTRDAMQSLIDSNEAVLRRLRIRRRLT